MLAVMRLGELLRGANIPVALDQFYMEEFSGGPDLGWLKWCEDHANESACVLIIGSEGWFSVYHKTGQPGVGLGAATEADLFRQLLYEGGGDNSRIRLAFLHDIPTQQVPVRLWPWYQFRPFDNGDQLSQLVLWISDWFEPTDRRPAALPSGQSRWRGAVGCMTVQQAARMVQRLGVVRVADGAQLVGTTIRNISAPN